MSMDIQAEWKHLMGRNAMEIMAWTTDFMRQYWRLTSEDSRVTPAQRQLLDDYRLDAMSSDYDYLIGVSAEFILEHAGIKLDSSYLARNLYREDTGDEDDDY
jgi:hypothetical protein